MSATPPSSPERRRLWWVVVYYVVLGVVLIALDRLFPGALEALGSGRLGELAANAEDVFGRPPVGAPVVDPDVPGVGLATISMVGSLSR